MNNSTNQIVKPLNSVLFKSFLEDQLTVKQVKEMKKSISERFTYIVLKIAEITDRTVHWYDYNNESGEYSPGFYDTEDYKESVGYVGEFSDVFSQILRFEKYDQYFPTKWFYSNFESELKNEKKLYLTEQKKREDSALKGKNVEEEQMQKMRDAIFKKLTQEELAYISFVKLEEVIKNKQKLSKSIATEVSQFIKEMKQKGVPISEQYENYRQGKKKAKSFNSWILKNMEKIRELANKDSQKEKLIAAWPFPYVNK